MWPNKKGIPNCYIHNNTILMRLLEGITHFCKEKARIQREFCDAESNSDTKMVWFYQVTNPLFLQSVSIIFIASEN